MPTRREFLIAASTITAGLFLKLNNTSSTETLLYSRISEVQGEHIPVTVDSILKPPPGIIPTPLPSRISSAREDSNSIYADARLKATPTPTEIPNPVYAIISRVEDQIRNGKTESGYFFDKNGVIILKEDGEEGVIYTPREVWPKVRDSIHTHNHPPYVTVDGKRLRTFLPLSIQDLNTAGILQLEEIRAVSRDPDTGNKTCSWAKKGQLRYWPELMTSTEAINGHINDVYWNELKGPYYGKDKNGQNLYNWQLADKAMSIVCIRLANELGFEYEYKEWR